MGEVAEKGTHDDDGEFFFHGILAAVWTTDRHPFRLKI